MNNVTLNVNGNNYSGWKSINIIRGIEQVAGTFELTVTEKWPGNPAARVIRPGSFCDVWIDDDLVITGYVDDNLPSIDSTNHTVTIKGRDKTGDLVDCSAVYKTGEWNGKKIEVIASDLCKAFGITVTVQTDTGEPFAKASIEQGETVFELLERLARQRGVLLTSDGLGSLVITRSGTARVNTVLQEGVNIKVASGNYSHRDRFSHYIGKGQHAGDDFLNSTTAAQPTAVITDDKIRYRPKVIIAEDNATIDSLTKRCVWQRNVNTGRSTNLTLTVADWKQNNVLWQPNQLIKVESDSLGVNTELLISEVGFQLNEAGTNTTLTVMPPDAFDLLSIPEPKEDGGFL